MSRPPESHEVKKRPTQRRLAAAVLERHPRSYAEELGVGPLDTPSGLFKLLVVALLMSARIRASVAAEAAAALFRQRWTTPRRMAAAGWSERAATLNRAGYARYDERTSTMLGDTAELVVRGYRGDLRRLRADAGRDPGMERDLLKEFKGIGDVGADIFLRDVQAEWHELYPFADRRALDAARHIGLPASAAGLARLAPGNQLVSLLNALVRMDLEDTATDVRRSASRARDRGPDVNVTRAVAARSASA